MSDNAVINIYLWNSRLQSDTVLLVKPAIPFLLVLCSALTVAQDKGSQSSPCPKNMPIDEFLLPDDAAAAKAAFEELRLALLEGDRSQVIALIAFPADLVLGGRGVKFDTAQELAKQYDRIFTTYVKNSVREQNANELVAGWEGVSLSNRALSFRRLQSGDFKVNDVRPRPVTAPTGFVKEFMDKRRTCSPAVVEGRVAGFNWVSHAMPGFENIYVDHLIVDVAKVLRGTLPEHRIRVDFWGVSHLPEYNLPATVFRSGPSWRIYLRRADEPPDNPEVCGQDVQETFRSVDENGRELEKTSAITSLSGENALTYAGLPCFEAGQQFFEMATTESTLWRLPINITH